MNKSELSSRVAVDASLPPHNEAWPALEPRERALFGPARDGTGTHVLLETGRVRDPRELATRPRVAQHCQLTTVGGEVTDWHWIDDDHTGQRGPEMEEWQRWPAPIGPLVLPVWTVAQREPLRLGRPDGTVWLDLDAADAEAEAEARAALRPLHTEDEA